MSANMTDFTELWGTKDRRLTAARFLLFSMNSLFSLNSFCPSVLIIFIFLAAVTQLRDAPLLTLSFLFVVFCHFRVGHPPQTSRSPSVKIFRSLSPGHGGKKISFFLSNTTYYYMDRSVLLKTKTLVESINHYIRDPSDVFSVCHSRE